MASVELLSNAFVYWIKGSSREQFDLIVEGFIEQAEEQVANRSYAEKKQKQVIFVRLLFLLFGASSDCKSFMLLMQACFSDIILIYRSKNKIEKTTSCFYHQSYTHCRESNFFGVHANDVEITCTVNSRRSKC